VSGRTTLKEGEFAVQPEAWHIGPSMKPSPWRRVLLEKFFIQSRKSHSNFESDVSLSCSQMPNTFSYYNSDKYSACHPILTFKIQFKITLPSILTPSK
jgi:hypothetical protein